MLINCLLWGLELHSTWKFKYIAKVSWKHFFHLKHQLTWRTRSSDQWSSKLYLDGKRDGIFVTSKAKIITTILHSKKLTKTNWTKHLWHDTIYEKEALKQICINISFVPPNNKNPPPKNPKHLLLTSPSSERFYVTTGEIEVHTGHPTGRCVWQLVVCLRLGCVLLTCHLPPLLGERWQAWLHRVRGFPPRGSWWHNSSPGLGHPPPFHPTSCPPPFLLSLDWIGCGLEIKTEEETFSPS